MDSTIPGKLGSKSCVIICEEESRDTGEREAQGQCDEPGHTANNRELSTQATGKGMFRQTDGRTCRSTSSGCAPQTSTAVHKTAPVAGRQAVESRK